MLVLSRREDQKILFPALGIRIEVLGVRGRNVKLGVDAPPNIRIVRDELVSEQNQDWNFEEREALDLQNGSDSDTKNVRSSRHRLNNRLNAISLRLQIAEKLFARGESDRGQAEIQSVLEELSSLEESETSAGQTESTRLNSAICDHHRMTVLLVEDNPNERQLLSTILNMASVNVISVENGEEALLYLKKNPVPDVILIDMQMPGLNGPQTISILRNDEEFSDVPIYGVSGSQRSELNIPLNAQGVNGWFAKPVQAEKLLEQILAEHGNGDESFAGLN